MRQSMASRSVRISIYAALFTVLALGTWADNDGTAAQQAPVSPSGGGKNIVLVTNFQNGGTQVRGHIQLNRIPGPLAAPSNIATATSSCSQCQTLAVALQVNVISTSTRVAAPENVAVASNAGCADCATLAWAIQYVVAVDDPTQELPPNVQRFVAALNAELVAASTSAFRAIAHSWHAGGHPGSRRRTCPVA